jgi:hypothetical protein
VAGIDWIGVAVAGGGVEDLPGAAIVGWLNYSIDLGAGTWDGARVFANQLHPHSAGPLIEDDANYLNESLLMIRPVAFS